MTALLLHHRQDGTLISKCDEKCYNGKGPTCVCCCGGRNHGVGIDAALRNLKDFELSAQVPYLPYDHERQTFLSIPAPLTRVQQPTLFEE